MDLDRILQERKHVSNLRFKFLDGLTYRRPLWERYLDGTIDLHLKVVSEGHEIGACLQGGACLQASDALARQDLPRNAVEDDEFSVLVFVGDVPEQARPHNSLIRLYLPDDASSRAWRYTVQERHHRPSRLGVFAGDPSVEALWRAFQWKLRRTLLASAADDAVVESGAEVVDGLSDPKPEVVFGAVWCRQLHEFLTRLRVFVGVHEATLCFDGVEQAFDVRDVFFCPVVPQLRLEERIWLRHALTSS